MNPAIGPDWFGNLGHRRLCVFCFMAKQVNGSFYYYHIFVITIFSHIFYVESTLESTPSPDLALACLIP
jgi:hypothetical protein